MNTRRDTIATVAAVSGESALPAAAVKAASRTPSPPGTKITRKPVTHDSTPANTMSRTGACGSKVWATNHVDNPMQSHDVMWRRTSTTDVRHGGTCCGSPFPSTLSASAKARRSTLGCKAMSPTGTSAKTHRLLPASSLVTRMAGRSPAHTSAAHR